MLLQIVPLVRELFLKELLLRPVARKLLLELVACGVVILHQAVACILRLELFTLELFRQGAVALIMEWERLVELLVRLVELLWVAITQVLLLRV